MFAFVKLIPDRADVEPASVAAELVPKTEYDRSVPLISTFGPIMNPRYKTYPELTVNVGKFPAEEGVAIAPDVFTFVNIAPVKFTFETFKTFRKSKFVKLALLKLTPGPITNPPEGLDATRRLYTYGLESVGPDASESISIHPDFTFVNVAFVKLADDQFMVFDTVSNVKLERFAPLRSTCGPCKKPPNTLYLGGSVG
jgi:hypothetical protein